MSIKKNVAVFEHLFWRRRIRRRQTIFQKFLKNIMKVNYSFYKRCKFHMGL